MHITKEIGTNGNTNVTGLVSKHNILFFTVKKNKETKLKEGFLISAEGTIIKELGAICGYMKMPELDPIATGICQDVFCFNPELVCVDPLHTVQEVLLEDLLEETREVFQRFLVQGNTKAKAIKETLQHSQETPKSAAEKYPGCFPPVEENKEKSKDEDINAFSGINESNIDEFIETRYEIMSSLQMIFMMAKGASKKVKEDIINKATEIVKKSPKIRHISPEQVNSITNLIGKSFDVNMGIEKRMKLAEEIIMADLMTPELFETLTPLELVLKKLIKNIK